MEPLRVDAKNLRCPMPIVEVAKVARNAPPGAELIVSATDPAFAMDIEAWCRRTGSALVSINHEGEATVAHIQLATSNESATSQPPHDQVT